MSFSIAGFIWLLLLASLTTAAAHRLRMPYTVALVLVGVSVSAFGLLHDLRPSSAAILLIFLPPLLFEAAMHFDLRAVGRALPEILVLAIPGVVVSAILIGFVLHRFAPLSLWPALLFGAFICATDPVSVITTFRRVGVPTHLSAIVEGESVLNDGTAVALSAVLLTAAQTGHLNVGPAIVNFLYALSVAALIGFAAGACLAAASKVLDDDLVETTLSVVLAYGSYLLADHAGASGIIGVVFAGLTYGSLGRQFALSKRSRIFLDGFWHYFQFLANAILFILIGLEIRIGVLWSELRWVLLAVVVVLVVRALLVYAFTLVMHRVSFAYGHILVWGGLRGGVALAVALSLPASIPGRRLMLALTFGVVLFTTLVQGLSVEPLVRRLGLTTPRDQGDAGRSPAGG